jgi:hypothetical protein
MPPLERGFLVLLSVFICAEALNQNYCLLNFKTTLPSIARLSTSSGHLRHYHASKPPGKETESAFSQVASKGIAGVLSIAAAEAVFWALGVPLAQLWYKVTTGEWVDLGTPQGQIQAAGFSFGYGGFATLILQYRVTLFALPLVPIMEKYVVVPARRILSRNDNMGN